MCKPDAKEDPIQKRDYDTMYNKNTGSTETHIAVDEQLESEDPRAYVEGFASASGIRPETAESGGRIKHPEDRDAPQVEGQLDNMLDEENARLANS